MEPSKTKQKETKYSIKSSDKATLNEFDHKQARFETMLASKSFNKHPKHKDLYHALMESILMDEDAMDQGVAEEHKKRKPADDDRDKNPSAGPDQGLKRRKTSKDAKPSKKINLPIDYTAFAMNRLQISNLTKADLVRPVYNLLKSTYSMEGDFPRLHLNDIEDMLLLIVQNKLFNLKSDVIVDLAAALRVIYEDKLNRKRLMRSDELHKFSDGTLQSV
ncbi:hypothetical protein Tco_0498627 [Tanacetum coccineum]